MARWIAKPQDAVLACSALKKSYRDHLTIGAEVRFVYLKGSYGLIAQRLRLRHGHFASEPILASQFAAPRNRSMLITVEIDQPPEQIVREIKGGSA